MWILFSVLAAFFWASGNIFDKYFIGNKIKRPAVLLVALGFVHLVTSLIIYLVHGLEKLSYFHIFLAAIYGNLFILVSYFYFKSLMKGEVSKLVPLLQLSPLFTLIFAFVFLGEVFIFSQYIGIFLLIFGALLLSLKKSMTFDSIKPYLLIICVAFVFSIGDIIVKYLLNFADFWSIYAYFRLTMLPALLIIIYLNFPAVSLTLRRQSKKIILLLLLGQCLALVGVLSFIYSIALGPVTLVRALASLQPFFVLIFAVVFSIFSPKILKEEMSKSALILKVISIVLIFIGVILIT
ncbi:MAG: EamA family transporter [Nanoarchaeota archaeon]|nr:EamA family transporter [Nanoarchaeota archaeon]MBU4352179.1 EamA family transporter [Nanoarchaeota archaeon]